MDRVWLNGGLALDTMKASTTDFIDALVEGDRVALYDYNVQAELKHDLSHDHNLIIDQGVARLEPTDVAETCLYGAFTPQPTSTPTPRPQVATPSDVVTLDGNIELIKPDSNSQVLPNDVEFQWR